MKHPPIYFLFILCAGLLWTACSQDPADENLVIHSVKPGQTADNIQNNHNHQVYYHTSVARKNKLLVFLGGAYSDPSDYTKFCTHAASQGFHVINLAYMNTVSVQTCANSNDQSCFEAFREEIHTGNSVSSEVNINAANSVLNRLKQLLVYLVQQYPAEGWDTYLAGDQPLYDRMLLAGHSLGSGQAAYFAYHHQVERLIVFAGPNDFSQQAGMPAPWLSGNSVTPANRFYGLLHLNEDVLTYENQRQAWMAMSLTPGNVINADILSNVSQGNRAFYTNITPKPGLIQIGRKHSAMIADAYTPESNGQPVLAPVWTYLLGN